MKTLIKLSISVATALALMVGSANAWSSGGSLSRTVNELRSHGYSVSVSGSTITATRGGQTRIITVNSSTGDVESSRSYSRNYSSSHDGSDDGYDDGGYDDHDNGYDDHDDGHDDHDDGQNDHDDGHDDHDD